MASWHELHDILLHAQRVEAQEEARLREALDILNHRVSKLEELVNVLVNLEMLTHEHGMEKMAWDLRAVDDSLDSPPAKR